MDTVLKSKLEEIKKLVSDGKVDDALNNLDIMLESNEFKPYESALKKIKIDIIYGKNLERINNELGKKTYSKVVSELDSAIAGVKSNKDEPAQNPQVPPGIHPPSLASAHSMRGAPLPPLPPPMPMPVIKIPKEWVEKDPYDIDNLDITHEVGPLGVLNDIRRTAISLLDPMFPIKLLEKESKKK